MNKPCYRRGFYIYKVIQLKMLEPMVLNITIPKADDWDITALKQIREADEFLFNTLNNNK